MNHAILPALSLLRRPQPQKWRADSSRYSINSKSEIDFHFSYGYPVQVGDDKDPMLWPQYRVAHLMLGSKIDDPAQPGKNALLFRVFLARQEQWEQFEVPDVIKEIWEEEAQERANSSEGVDSIN